MQGKAGFQGFIVMASTRLFKAQATW